jgi:hypothetical protein
MHGADCQICTEEAVIAARMKKEGKTIQQVQQAIDKKFADQYPFEKPTMQLVRYRAKAAGMQANMLPEASGEKAKLKPGAKAGDCCGGKKTQ